MLFLNQIKNVNFGIFDNNHWLDDKSSDGIISVNKIQLTPLMISKIFPLESLIMLSLLTKSIF